MKTRSQTRRSVNLDCIQTGSGSGHRGPSSKPVACPNWAYAIRGNKARRVGTLLYKPKYICRSAKCNSVNINNTQTSALPSLAEAARLATAFPAIPTREITNRNISNSSDTQLGISLSRLTELVRGSLRNPLRRALATSAVAEQPYSHHILATAKGTLLESSEFAADADANVAELNLSHAPRAEIKSGISNDQIINNINKGKHFCSLEFPSSSNTEIDSTISENKVCAISAKSKVISAIRKLPLRILNTNLFNNRIIHGNNSENNNEKIDQLSTQNLATDLSISENFCEIERMRNADDKENGINLPFEDNAPIDTEVTWDEVPVQQTEPMIEVNRHNVAPGDVLIARPILPGIMPITIAMANFASAVINIRRPADGFLRIRDFVYAQNPPQQEVPRGEPVALHIFRRTHSLTDIRELPEIASHCDGNFTTAPASRASSPTTRIQRICDVANIQPHEFPVIREIPVGALFRPSRQLADRQLTARNINSLHRTRSVRDIVPFKERLFSTRNVKETNFVEIAKSHAGLMLNNVKSLGGLLQIKDCIYATSAPKQINNNGTNNSINVFRRTFSLTDITDWPENVFAKVSLNMSAPASRSTSPKASRRSKTFKGVEPKYHSSSDKAFIKMQNYSRLSSTNKPAAL